VLAAGAGIAAAAHHSPHNARPDRHCCAGCTSCSPGCARVHEVLWDVPADGLQLPSISTVKCGDVIRFKCPAGAAHGVYKLAASE
jgi:hypothetical protein